MVGGRPASRLEIRPWLFFYPLRSMVSARFFPWTSEICLTVNAPSCPVGQPADRRDVIVLAVKLPDLVVVAPFARAIEN